MVPMAELVGAGTKWEGLRPSWIVLRAGLEGFGAGWEGP